jgi:hypothetical protein
MVKLPNVTLNPIGRQLTERDSLRSSKRVFLDLANGCRNVWAILQIQYFVTLLNAAGPNVALLNVCFMDARIIEPLFLT